MERNGKELKGMETFGVAPVINEREIYFKQKYYNNTNATTTFQILDLRDLKYLSVSIIQILAAMDNLKRRPLEHQKSELSFMISVKEHLHEKWLRNHLQTLSINFAHGHNPFRYPLNYSRFTPTFPRFYEYRNPSRE